MKNKEYSRLEEIKRYKGNDNTVKGTLVLEGGAFRGLYTAGVLDCLIDNDINIENVIGISAGALNGCNYLAGSRGRSAYCILKYRFNKHYVGLDAVKESGSIVGFKFMFEDFNKEIPLDEDRIFNSNRNLYVGAVNVNTGDTEYFHIKDEETMKKAVSASASMPLVSKMVKINDGKYLDGGCKTKLPIKFAINNKFEKIIFVGTRPITYRRKLISPELKLEKARYKNYPKFLEALKNANKTYNQDAEFLETLATKKAILTICPSERVSVKRLEKDVEKLGELYWLGYDDCKNKLDDIKKYLGI